MLQVLSGRELAFPFSGDVEFEDAEHGARKLVDARSASREYQSSLAAFIDRTRRDAQQDGIEYALASTDSPPERMLREYLLRRDAMHGAPQPGTGIA
jgi:hypothetical protein